MKIFLVTLAMFGLVGCGTGTDEKRSMQKEDFVESPINQSLTELVYCPAGFEYDDETRLCANDSEAMGPFTSEMTKSCKNLGYTFCDDSIWEKGIAAELRGNMICPIGSSLNTVTGHCGDAVYIYGPFRIDEVKSCQTSKASSQCLELRWLNRFDLVGVNSALNKYYSVKSNYNKVYKDVMKWYGTTTMGCVAFLSTAMRHTNINIPQSGSMNGKSISLNTEGFEAFVKAKLNWKQDSVASRLLPGDVVISQDRYAGHPDHVYMFHAWQDKVKSVAYVIDNQGFTHLRNIVGFNGPITRRPYARHYRTADSQELFNLIYAQK